MAYRALSALRSALGLSMGIAIASASLTGCALVYPEYAMHLAVAPALGQFDPPPPEDRLYIEVIGAKIPPKTRDGREWGELLGSLPDPFLKISLNNVEVFRTDPESDTLAPTWKSAPHGNFPVRMGDTVTLEIWDANTLIDHPIGIRQFALSSEMLTEDKTTVKFEGGVELYLHIQPPKPLWGVGMKYEVHNGGASITSVMDGSPASRGGMKPGDKLLKIAGKDAAKMSSDDVLSEMNSVPVDGIKLTVQHADGSTVDAVLKEGPIYGLFKDVGDPNKVDN